MRSPWLAFSRVTRVRSGATGSGSQILVRLFTSIPFRAIEQNTGRDHTVWFYFLVGPERGNSRVWVALPRLGFVELGEFTPERLVSDSVGDLLGEVAQ